MELRIVDQKTSLGRCLETMGRGFQAWVAVFKPGSEFPPGLGFLIFKPGSQVFKPGSPVFKPGSLVFKPGSLVFKPGLLVFKPGSKTKPLCGSIFLQIGSKSTAGTGSTANNGLHTCLVIRNYKRQRKELESRDRNQCIRLDVTWSFFNYLA